MARSGGLDGALNQTGQFYQTNFTKALLFLTDGSYLEERASQQNLLGSQWGMMNETGNFPGQAWLWLYTFWYQVPPFSTSDNADAQIWGIMGILSLLFILLPFIPGVRSIPRWIPLYKLIWRDYYRAARAGERAARRERLRAPRRSVGGEVEIGGRVRRRHLRADPRRAARNDREREADRVDAQLGRSLLGEARGGDLVADHHGHDRMLAGEDVEPELGHAGAEVGGVVAEVVAQLGGALDQIERGEARGDDRRGEAVREEVGAGALAEQLDDLGARRRRSRRSRRRPPCRACR